MKWLDENAGNKRKFQQITITLESETDIAIIMAMLESTDSNFDNEVTRELFYITGIDEGRNISKDKVTNVLQELHDFLRKTIEEIKNV